MPRTNDNKIIWDSFSFDILVLKRSFSRPCKNGHVLGCKGDAEPILRWAEPIEHSVSGWSSEFHQTILYSKFRDLKSESDPISYDAHHKVGSMAHVQVSTRDGSSPKKTSPGQVQTLASLKN